MSTEYETTMQDEAVCPHCGERNPCSCCYVERNPCSCCYVEYTYTTSKEPIVDSPVESPHAATGRAGD